MRSVEQEKSDAALFKAYQMTIEDFEIALSYTEWYQFRRRKYLRKQIEEYEEKLRTLEMEMLLSI